MSMGTLEELHLFTHILSLSQSVEFHSRPAVFSTAFLPLLPYEREEGWGVKKKKKKKKNQPNIHTNKQAKTVLGSLRPKMSDVYVFLCPQQYHLFFNYRTLLIVATIITVNAL